MTESYLKMADVFRAKVRVDSRCYLSTPTKEFIAFDDDETATCVSHKAAKYAAHAINSHDELVRQRDELLDAMSQTLAMLRVTSHGPSAANKAEDMLHAAICSLGTDHSPDAGKMVLSECNVEPMTLDEAITHANEKSIGSSQCAAQHAQLAKWLTDYRAMLAAAPKLGDE